MAERTLMPKSMFRVVEPAKPPDRHERFMKIIDVLMQRLEDVPRMDIRDYVAACGVIDRALAREKPDDPAAAGSTARDYQRAFKTPNGASQRNANTGSSPDQTAAGEWDRGADAGEPADAEADGPADAG